MKILSLGLLSVISNIVADYYIKHILKLKEERVYFDRRYNTYYFKYVYSTDISDPLDFCLFNRSFWVDKHWFEVHNIKVGYIKNTCLSNSDIFKLKLANPTMQILYGGK